MRLRPTIFVAAIALIGLSAAPVPAATLDHSTAAAVQLITNICGANGCVRVQTQRIRHQKPGSLPANHI
jgi:hypothetical protein